MVEYLATQEEVPPFHELYHLSMVDHRYIQHAIVWNGIGGLPITRSITHTHRHHSPVYSLAIDVQAHLVFKSLKYHQHKGEQERECSRHKEMACLPAQVHNSGYQAHVDAVEKVAVTGFAVLITVVHAPNVNAAYAALAEPLNGLLNLTLTETPEMGEVIHHAIGDNAQGDTATGLAVQLHHAVGGIVEG